VALFLFVALYRAAAWSRNWPSACHSRAFISKSKLMSESSEISPDRSQKLSNWENEKVEKGLTHIKRNKYAPTPEEAATMTDDEFRQVLYKRMKEAERERRSKGPIGNASSDDYLESLSRKKN